MRTPILNQNAASPSDLQALVLSPRPMRPVRPMFMVDFYDAFFYAYSEAPVAGDTVAVRRAYPSLWELYRRASGWPGVGNAVALAQKSTGKPVIADILAAENKRETISLIGGDRRPFTF